MPGSPAVAYLKGFTDKAIPLTFDRIEPYIVPKRSLTGDNRERIDTRVLQVIYRFEKPAFSVYVGQQVDIYIERSNNPGGPKGETRLDSANHHDPAGHVPEGQEK